MAPENESAGNESAPHGQTLWHGRFAGGPAEELLAYTVSLPFDQRLFPDDIAGSLRSPWLGLFGDLDPSIPVDDVERLRHREILEAIDAEMVAPERENPRNGKHRP